MAEASPVVGKESPIAGVPTFSFQEHSCSFVHPLFSFGPAKKVHPASKFAPRSLSTCNRAESSNESGCCPHILIADDDPFQHFYYQSFFQKTVELDEFNITREDLRIELCQSGEELIEKCEKIINCECENLAIVITDYNMGVDKLNGVETAIGVRKVGYSGSIILRTSETREYLKEKHQDFDELLLAETVDAYVEKEDFIKVKEIVKECMHRKSKLTKEKSDQDSC